MHEQNTDSKDSGTNNTAALTLIDIGRKKRAYARKPSAVQL